MQLLNFLSNPLNTELVTVKKMFGVFIVRISAFSPPVGKYGPEKPQIQTLFTQRDSCGLIKFFVEKFFHKYEQTAVLFGFAHIHQMKSITENFIFLRIELRNQIRYI